MTNDNPPNPLFTGINLAEAVGSGDGAAIRQISSEVESSVIQSNGTHTFINTFLLLNQLDGKDFPIDVWQALPDFLIKDIKDRSVILGCSEDLVHGMVGSFLRQNVYSAVEGEEPKLLNPDGYSAGYFHIAVAVGEAVYGMLKVTAEKRFNGDYALTKSLVTDYLSLVGEVESESVSD